MSSRRCPLRGRVVVVTGAARGIGAALAHRLAARGAHVALLGLETQALRELAASLPAPSHHWPVDVTDDVAMATAAREVRARLGPPSVAIANAGVAQAGYFADTEPASWRRVVDVNLLGSAVTARVFLPDLLRTRGYYLQVASLAAIGAVPMMSAYCASKAGSESLAHSLRAELAPRGVAVGIAYMNWTDTDMIREGDQYQALHELRARLPPPARTALPVGKVAERLVGGVERRAPTIYVPGWLRSVQAVRPLLPPLVTRYSQRSLTRLRFAPTGLLGAGGRAAGAGRRGHRA